jgi:hypothetical protein
MSNYAVAFLQSVFGRGTWMRAAHIFVAAILGGGAIAEYANIREKIDASVGFHLMPTAPTLWLLWGVFAASIILRLGHNEAMRRSQAANIVFGPPYKVKDPTLSNRICYRRTCYHTPRTKIHDFYAIKIDVRNIPHRADDGKDVGDAWSLFELFDLNSKPIVSWRDGRWEDNKQPGYANHAIDHYPDDQKVRTLSANGRPNILCVALKPVADADASFSRCGSNRNGMASQRY